MVHDNDDDIIELTQVIPEASSDGGDRGIIKLTDMETAGGDAGFDDDILELGEPIPDEPDDDAADTAVTTDIPAMPETLADIPGELLDAALERVIEKKFSKTIEKVLFEVTEKVIQREIADIRAALQKDLDEIGNA